MKLPDPRIHYAMTMLRGIGRARPGQLAALSGETLYSIAGPLAVKVSVELPGLERELFEKGEDRHLARIDKALKDYGLDDPRKERGSPDFLNISTHDGRLLSIGANKYLGAPTGWVTALADDPAHGILPPDESVYLCTSQLSARVNAILSPGSVTAAEVLCRRILSALESSGVRAVAAQMTDDADFSLSIVNTEGKIACRENDPVYVEKNKMPGDGEELHQDVISHLWPNQSIQAGLWINDLPGYLLAIGFDHKKDLTKKTINTIKAEIDDLSARDTDYIIKAFERLKSDFKKMVKTERTAAITETAITVNHEINNPLTAILGNTQLLLMGREKLPGDVIVKLETIEKSAIQIRETTAKLMAIIEPVKSSYSSGIDMIDIEKSKKKSSQ